MLKIIIENRLRILTKWILKLCSFKIIKIYLNSISGETKTKQIWCIKSDKTWTSVWQNRKQRIHLYFFSLNTKESCNMELTFSYHFKYDMPLALVESDLFFLWRKRFICAVYAEIQKDFEDTKGEDKIVNEKTEKTMANKKETKDQNLSGFDIAQSSLKVTI